MLKGELEQLDITRLAVMCSKAAEALDGDAAETGRNLKGEWVVLVARDTPPGPSYAEHQQVQAELAALKKRMVEYLLVAG